LKYGVPIEVRRTIRNLTPSEFDEVDRLVMPLAYAAQNALGRLWDESVYESELAGLLEAAGVPEVHRQVPLIVRHDTFEKVYRLDLVVCHAIYELKAVQELASEHDAQVFHYAMLVEVNHIKLLNFRPPKVRGLLRYNAVLGRARRAPRWHDREWNPITPRCHDLRQRLGELLADWGTHLSPRLYAEALVVFCGGEVACVQRVPVMHNGRRLGSHHLASHTEGLAFLVTAFPDPERQTRHIEHLRRLTGRHAIQWMNLDRDNIQLVTVR
jgi:GxxExxY protein